MDDGKIIEDPPTRRFSELARPLPSRLSASRFPPCTPYAAAVLGYCETLRADASRYLAAIQRTVAVDAALVATVNRVSGAARAHRAGALRGPDPARLHAALAVPFRLLRPARGRPRAREPGRVQGA